MAYHIGALPDRKSITLYRVQGCEIKPIAQFRSELDAREFMVFIDGMIFTGGLPVDEEWHGWAEVER